MPSLGPLEILVILVVALLVFGPDKLPDLARQVGKGMAELRRVQHGLRRELDDAIHSVIDDDAAETAATADPGAPVDAISAPVVTEPPPALEHPPPPLEPAEATPAPAPPRRPQQQVPPRPVPASPAPTEPPPGGPPRADDAS